MGTSKHVVILLTMALGGLLAAGQDKPATPLQTSQRRVSNTRAASCIVRITVDPAIMPLNLETIEGLLHSSAVLFKAGREVLSLNKPEDFARPLITVEWLNASSAPMPSGARPSGQADTGYDEEMRRQMEQIYRSGSQQQAKTEGLSLEEVYGRDYARQMGAVSGEQNRDGAKEGRPEGSRQRGGASGASGQGRSGDARTRGAAGGMGMMGGMGGYGGGMVSGMGGMGMGGMGGGMMGGYGGRGGMGFYGAPAAGQQSASGEQSATVKLYVDLPEDLSPVADEFLDAVVRNLQGSLSHAYESYLTEIERALGVAQAQHENVESELDGRAGDVARIKQQLEMEVDLSQLNRQTPLATAIEVLRKSVEPPLNIVVLWRDVQTNLSVEPVSPINIEGSPRTRLATALDLLVKGLYDGSATAMWRIKDDTIVIGTTATLGRRQDAAGQPRVEADAVNLAGQRSELARRIQTLELDLAGLDARQKAMQEQIAVTKQVANKRLAEDTVTRELQKLLNTSENNLSQLKDAARAGRVGVADLAQAEEGVAKVRIDLARRQEELTRLAGGGQLEEFTKELSRLAIDKAEKEAQLQIVRRQLDEVQKQLAQALTFDPKAARLRLAQEALDITGRRVAELQARRANLQPPMVTMIGAN